MKLFAKFYCMSTGYVEGSVPLRYSKVEVKPIEACGSGAVAEMQFPDRVIDLKEVVSSVRDVCRQRGYVGFALWQGADLASAVKFKDFELISYREPHRAFVYRKGSSAVYRPTLAKGDAETYNFASASSSAMDVGGLSMCISSTVTEENLREAIDDLQRLLKSKFKQ